jgi:uncharacterized protein (DUF885 family)
VLAILATGAGLFFFPMLARTQSETSQSESQNTEGRKFHAYLEQDWKHWMEDYPVMSTFVGFPGQNRRWSDDSPAGIEARIKHLHESLATLKTISRDGLPAAEQLNYDLYRALLETE